MFIPDERILRRILKLNAAGTRGGASRLEILHLLARRPVNTNEIATHLDVDYKTAQYHVRVLLRSGLIVSPDKKYDNQYQLAPLLRANTKLLEMDLGKRK